jgi:uncharacterized protein (DUF486 family)
LAPKRFGSGVRDRCYPDWNRPRRLFRQTPTTGSLFRAMKTIILLSLSNVFMTFAWYAHLKDLRDKPWIIAALVSWGVALFEYLLQVPANRAGYGQFDLGQLKIMQEIIALTVFVPFALFYMKEPLRLDFLWAGLCLVGAAYFMFRAPVSGGA